jgi:hypothetical protein
MLKIERISGSRGARIRLSGQLRSEHLEQLKSEIERGGPNVELDLEEVDLVDVEGVRFPQRLRVGRRLGPPLFVLRQGMDAAGTRKLMCISENR